MSQNIHLLHGMFSRTIVTLFVLSNIWHFKGDQHSSDYCYCQKCLLNPCVYCNNKKNANLFLEEKNSYRRHWISQHVWIIAPIPKWTETDREEQKKWRKLCFQKWRDRQNDRQTDIPTFRLSRPRGQFSENSSPLELMSFRIYLKRPLFKVLNLN